MQINFTPVASSDLSALPQQIQLQLLGELKNIPADPQQSASDKIGCLRRHGRKIYRYRANDYRIYFSTTDKGLLIQRVLHKNTLDDFLYRSNLPLVDEDSALEKNKQFWQFLEEEEPSNRTS